MSDGSDYRRLPLRQHMRPSGPRISGPTGRDAPRITPQAPQGSERLAHLRTPSAVSLRLWEIDEIHDKNHVMSSFRSAFEKHAFVLPAHAKRRRRVLNGHVYISLVTGFETLLRTGSIDGKPPADGPVDIVEKHRAWSGATKHCTRPTPTWVDKRNLTARSRRSLERRSI